MHCLKMSFKLALSELSFLFLIPVVRLLMEVDFLYDEW